jgi:hypothetical protein
VQAMIPEDPTALGDFIAGLHVVSELLLYELQEATGQPPAASLQKPSDPRGNPARDTLRRLKQHLRRTAVTSR